MATGPCKVARITRDCQLKTLVVVRPLVPKRLKKNQNAPTPSEYPPVKGKKMSKRIGGIIGCNNKTSSSRLNGFPDGSNIG